MKCAWTNFLNVIPQRFRADTDRLGKQDLQELRLRTGKPPQLVTSSGIKWLNGDVTEEELRFVINMASRYSPWSAQTARNGYITAPGGHRIGISGEYADQAGSGCGFRKLSSLCIRVARDLPGIARRIPPDIRSCLLIGPPGSGKTTLLRDLIRRISDEGPCVCVVDERGELFPPEAGFDTGPSTDIYTGCSKSQGIMMALKTMGPQWIAVDEITEEIDRDALISAFGCGVRLLATAHAADLRDLNDRPLYRPLKECRIFDTIVILQQDKSYRMERIPL